MMSAHDSFLNKTPEPAAWSTETKKEARFAIPAPVKQDVKRNLMDMDVSTESLGILSLDDMKPTKDSLTTIHIPVSQASNSSTSTNSMEERRRVLESTRALLEKYASRKNSVSVLSESTVNESDLRESSSNSNMMTPSKSSTINESDLLNKSNNTAQSIQNQSTNQRRNSNASTTSNTSHISNSAYINDLKMKLEANSSLSLSELLGNQTKQSLMFDSGMFQPAEDMKEQFEDDEKAWREKYASLPNATRVSFCSQGNSSDNFDEKISMGEFFRQKSDNCSLFQTSSPRNRKPIALINSTAIEDDKENIRMNDSVLSAINQSAVSNSTISSVFSLSDIQNLITGEENTPNKVIERLLKAPLATTLNKSHKSQKNKNHLQNHEQKLNKQENNQPVLLNDGYYNSRASLGSPSLSSHLKFSKYASSSDIRSPRKETMTSSTMYTAKSLSSIRDDKENVRSPRRAVEEKNRTLTSCRSTSSMESIPDNILKLASTKNELIWGCVKEGRAVQQDITIRNKNNRRVKYMIHTNNSTFKLTNIELQGDKAMILLHPLETRQLVISYSPSSIGPQIGNLYFTPVVRREEQITSRQNVSLFGYGGHTNIQIKGQTRDLAGKLWVSLGSLDGRHELIADFVVHNSGTIDGFVSLTVSSKSLCAYDDISLTPSKVIVKRGSETNVRVRFRPSKNDLQQLHQALGNKSMKASEIAVIRMISGADINRLRINKMNKKCDYNIMDPLGQQLNGAYQNAQRGEDIRHFNESSKSVKGLMQSLDCTEISLLVDRDMDSTLMPEADDSTVMFKTMMCQDESSLMDHNSEHSYLKSFNVEPVKVILTPPVKCNDYLLLSSNYDRPVQFNISVSPGGPMSVSPSSGEVRPGEILKVKVECDYRVTMARQDFDVAFEIEDEILKVIVSVLNL